MDWMDRDEDEVRVEVREGEEGRGGVLRLTGYGGDGLSGGIEAHSCSR